MSDVGPAEGIYPNVIERCRMTITLRDMMVRIMPFVKKVRVQYIRDNSGREYDLPALLTQDGILISHLRFLADPDYLRKSESWKSRNIYSIRLLLAYIHANSEVFESAMDVFKSFAIALEYGTVDIDTQTDPSGLYWLPRTAADARALIAHVTAYTDWLSEQKEYKQPPMNPLRKATAVEERLNWCAYYQKEANVFLAHVRSPQEAARKHQLIRSIRGPDLPSSSRKLTKRFPEGEFPNLLKSGWVRACGTIQSDESSFVDYKGRAISILMHYGGLRKSEIFHAYLQDIIIDRKSNDVIVRIYHPVEGRAPEEGYRNRQDYLARRYGMKPRNLYPSENSLHAGWKAPHLTDGANGYIEVHFFPLESSKEFLYNFIMYLRCQRVDPAPEDDHPFAFTNTRGHPESLKNFSRQHKAAVNRIGLDHQKKLGTTEHGHRHAYGYRLVENGIAPHIIQKAMHHKSHESQVVYTQPDSQEVRIAFMEAEKRMKEN